jgi:hypothetical protein
MLQSQDWKAYGTSSGHRTKFTHRDSRAIILVRIVYFGVFRVAIESNPTFKSLKRWFFV